MRNKTLKEKRSKPVFIRAKSRLSLLRDGEHGPMHTMSPTVPRPFYWLDVTKLQKAYEIAEVPEHEVPGLIALAESDIRANRDKIANRKLAFRAVQEQNELRRRSRAYQAAGANQDEADIQAKRDMQGKEREEITSAKPVPRPKPKPEPKPEPKGDRGLPKDLEDSRRKLAKFLAKNGV